MVSVSEADSWSWRTGVNARVNPTRVANSRRNTEVETFKIRQRVHGLCLRTLLRSNHPFVGNSQRWYQAGVKHVKAHRQANVMAATSPAAAFSWRRLSQTTNGFMTQSLWSKWCSPSFAAVMKPRNVRLASELAPSNLSSVMLAPWKLWLLGAKAKK